MTTAEDLVALVAQDLSEVEAQLRTHPFPSAVADGSCPPVGLAAFVGHQYHIAHSDIQSIALMVHHFGDRPYASFFQEVLEGEFAGRAGIIVLARKLGLSEADLQASEPSAEGFAYGAYLQWLASHGTAAEVLCGLLVNFAAWGFNCGRMGEGLRAHYDCTPADTVFLDAFAGLPSFADVALPVIQEGLDHGEEIHRIRRSARLFQAYEKMFWDAMAAEAGLD